VEKAGEKNGKNFAEDFVIRVTPISVKFARLSRKDILMKQPICKSPFGKTSFIGAETVGKRLGRVIALDHVVRDKRLRGYAAFRTIRFTF